MRLRAFWRVIPVNNELNLGVIIVGSTVRSGKLAAVLICIAGIAGAESLTLKDARKALPKGNRVEAVMPEAAFLDEKQQAIVLSLKDTIPYYGALALSPDEGLFVDWLNAAGQHHSIEAAREAALGHCNSNRKESSAECVVVLEVSPKGADPEAPISLSAEGFDALKGDYRKLKGAKAYAISPSTGNFGFARGDGGRALDACSKAGDGASDCKVVVAD